MRTTNRPRRPAALGAVIAGALAAVVLTGCGASTSDMGGVSIAPQSAPSFEMADMSYDDGGYASAAGADSQDYEQSASTGVMEQHIIRVGDASVTVDDPYAALTVLTEKVAALGGSVSHSSQWTTGERPRAEATLRVPADQFDALIAWLPDLGTLEHQSTQSEDVTTQVTDLTARIEALKTSIERLNGLMADAETTADLLEAESMLTYRQAELDSLSSTLAYLSDRVSLSSLTVSLSTQYDAPGPSLSWTESWNSFLNALIWLLNALIFALPWLLVATLLVVVWRTAKRLKKRPAIRSEYVADSTED